MHIRQKMSKLRHRVEDKLEHWEEKSKDLIGGFLGMFGRDGRIVSVCAREIVHLIIHSLPHHISFVLKPTLQLQWLGW